jgi:hypothetical protein
MGRLAEATLRLREGVGFRFELHLAGKHEAADGKRRGGAALRLAIGPNNFRHFLNRGHPDFLVQHVEGSVSLDGMCHEAPCDGRLTFSLSRASCEVEFDAEGRRARLTLEVPTGLPREGSFWCNGSVVAVETGERISAVEIRLSPLAVLRGLPRFHLK